MCRPSTSASVGLTSPELLHPSLIWWQLLALLRSMNLGSPISLRISLVFQTQLNSRDALTPLRGLGLSLELAPQGIDDSLKVHLLLLASRHTCYLCPVPSQGLFELGQTIFLTLKV